MQDERGQRSLPDGKGYHLMEAFIIIKVATITGCGIIMEALIRMLIISEYNLR